MSDNKDQNKDKSKVKIVQKPKSGPRPGSSTTGGSGPISKEKAPLPKPYDKNGRKN